MMYPRLKLARNLLADDGAIFVSIDDRELATSRLLCDEIFGPQNFLGALVWKNATDNNPTRIAVEHEYLLCYSRNRAAVKPVWKSADSAARDLLVAVGDELTSKFSNPDQLQAAYSAWFRENKTVLGPLDRYKYIDTQGVYTGSQSVHNPGKEGYRYDVTHPVSGKPCKEPLLGYRFPKETMDRLIEERRILFGKDESKIVELKVYAKDFRQKLASVIELDGRLGANELRELFPERKVFTNPKPVSLLRDIFSFVISDHDIVLDFFAGSGTTADAVMRINASLDSRARFILVQIPEGSHQVGFKTLADVARERISRAGKKILGRGSFPAPLDVGFRSLHIDTTNMADVLRTPNETGQHELGELEGSVKAGRTDEDLLFQVMLDWGLDLGESIAVEEIAGRRVLSVADNALIACLADEMTDEVIRAMAGRHPLRAVFLDAGFASDAARINAEQIFRELSPETDVRTI